MSETTIKRCALCRLLFSGTEHEHERECVARTARPRIRCRCTFCGKEYGTGDIHDCDTAPPGNLPQRRYLVAALDGDYYVLHANGDAATYRELCRCDHPDKAQEIVAALRSVSGA